MRFLKYKIELAFAKNRARHCQSEVAHTDAGSIEFISRGEGVPILLSHGIAGGCDQGPSIADAYIGDRHRIIAVSRFGYLRSPLPENSTPAAQADLYAALLDELGLDKAIVLGFSAGSASALQFALRHPDRCAGLILLSPANGHYPVPPKAMRFFLKSFFNSDFLFWSMTNYLRSAMFRMMGVPYLVQCRLTVSQLAWLSKVMRSYLPVSYRVKGIMNDICVSNPDLGNDYFVNRIAVPTLIIHAVDDSLTRFNNSLKMYWQIPGAEFMQIDSGGHMLMGYHKKVRNRIEAFVARIYESTKKALVNVS